MLVSTKRISLVRLFARQAAARTKLTDFGDGLRLNPRAPLKLTFAACYFNKEVP
jgi:hypothetical protein